MIRPLMAGMSHRLSRKNRVYHKDKVEALLKNVRVYHKDKVEAPLKNVRVEKRELFEKKTQVAALEQLVVEKVELLEQTDLGELVNAEESEDEEEEDDDTVLVFMPS